VTTKKDYTTEEWNQLLESPLQAGYYVIYADPSITGVFKEMKALYKAILEQTVPDGAKDLVGSLVADIKKKSENKEEMPSSDDMSKGDPKEVMARMLEFVKGVVVLVDAKATSEEAVRFKEWLYAVAKAVSEAAKEGGFMGIGGEQVSDNEKDALENLKSTLHLW
jgi:hypothetical protein